MVALAGVPVPEIPSSLVVPTLDIGDGFGSTETTDLMGKTRSLAEELNRPRDESREDAVGELRVWSSCGFAFSEARWDCGTQVCWSEEVDSE